MLILQLVIFDGCMNRHTQTHHWCFTVFQLEQSIKEYLSDEDNTSEIATQGTIMVLNVHCDEKVLEKWWYIACCEFGSV